MRESGLTEILPVIGTSDILACVPLFSTPSPLRAHGRERLQWLRAWQLAACLSPSFVSILSSLGAGCSGLMAATSFVYWFGSNVFSLTPWTSEESFSHCLGPMEKVSYFHKHERDPCPLAALKPYYHLGWFLQFQRNETRQLQGGREDHCGMGWGYPVLLAPRLRRSIRNKWDHSDVFLGQSPKAIEIKAKQTNGNESNL